MHKLNGIWRRRKGVVLLALTGSVYVILYIIDSSLGGYWLDRDWHPNDHWSPSAFYWQPAIGHRAYFVSDSDWIGILYSPLVAIDREWIHPVLVRGDRKADQRVDNLRVCDIHPLWRNRFLEIQARSKQLDEDEQSYESPQQNK